LATEFFCSVRESFLSTAGSRPHGRTISGEYQRARWICSFQAAGRRAVWMFSNVQVSGSATAAKAERSPRDAPACHQPRTKRGKMIAASHLSARQK